MKKKMCTVSESKYEFTTELLTVLVIWYIDENLLSKCGAKALQMYWNQNGIASTVS